MLAELDGVDDVVIVRTAPRPQVRGADSHRRRPVVVLVRHPDDRAVGPGDLPLGDSLRPVRRPAARRRTTQDGGPLPQHHASPPRARGEPMGDRGEHAPDPAPTADRHEGLGRQRVQPADACGTGDTQTSRPVCCRSPWKAAASRRPRAAAAITSGCSRRPAGPGQGRRGVGRGDELGRARRSTATVYARAGRERGALGPSTTSTSSAA